MRRRVIPGLVAVTALSACATPPAAKPDPVLLHWSFDQSEAEGAKLAYGPPNTDDVLVMMTCRPRSGVVRISTAARSAAASPVLRLTSRAVSSQTTGRIDATDPLGPRLEAVAPVANPALAAFATSGQLVVQAGGATFAAPAADPTPVRNFFASCRP